MYQRLETGLILTLLWAPFFLYPVELYIYAFPMVEVMILITAAAGFCRLMAALGARLRSENVGLPAMLSRCLSALSWIDLAVLGMALLGGISLLWAEQPAPARTELRTLIIEPLLFYALLRVTRPGKRALLRLFAALVAAAVMVALIGIAMYFSQEGSFYSAEWGFRRLDSVYGSANNAGLLFGRAIPIALAFLLNDIGGRARLLAGLALLIMLPALALTMSSGAILFGLPAGLIMVLLGAYGRRAYAPLLAIGAVGGAVFLALTRLSDRLANVLNFSGGTTFVRIRLWESSLAMLGEHPLTGIGLDQFLYQFGGEYLKPDAIWDPDLSHPHNFALDFWLRLGILGLLCFALMQAAFWRAISRLLRRRGDEDRLSFAMALGLAGSMAALLAHGLIDNSVFVIDLAFIFMFQLAACQRLTELSRETDA